ncbi:hypothetical protein MJO29_012729 [Puccinia striiformis f. sp. tritici]|nr:hypothetical protein MJO29_012729 [Puccinia striiformis f. sp. tritici]
MHGVEKSKMVIHKMSFHAGQLENNGSHVSQSEKRSDGCDLDYNKFRTLECVNRVKVSLFSRNNTSSLITIAHNGWIFIEWGCRRQSKLINRYDTTHHQYSESSDGQSRTCSFQAYSCCLGDEAKGSLGLEVCFDSKAVALY